MRRERRKLCDISGWLLRHYSLVHGRRIRLVFRVQKQAPELRIDGAVGVDGQREKTLLQRR